ncbi:type-1 angiotensin II receptor-associated protein isoform X1 [Cygnus olor]|uniref:type-1 angiotensin II receptor-associated protein isoform X1 n=1 Tax=Cygnus olor TaxID=8869 RepID=UPI001ADEB1A2|nr:type-1 angiotensin II receptor-associated protein isoform X1 [Cygnus olor]
MDVWNQQTHTSSLVVPFHLGVRYTSGSYTTQATSSPGIQPSGKRSPLAIQSTKAPSKIPVHVTEGAVRGRAQASTSLQTLQRSSRTKAFPIAEGPKGRWSRPGGYGAALGAEARPRPGCSRPAALLWAAPGPAPQGGGPAAGSPGAGGPWPWSCLPSASRPSFWYTGCLQCVPDWPAAHSPHRHHSCLCLLPFK